MIENRFCVNIPIFPGFPPFLTKLYRKSKNDLPIQLQDLKWNKKLFLLFFDWCSIAGRKVVLRRKKIDLNKSYVV